MTTATETEVRRFRHVPNAMLSRDMPMGQGPANIKYVVNQGNEPPEKAHPTVRAGYKEISFRGHSIVSTSDPEIIAFLEKKVREGKCIDVDAEERERGKLMTEDDLEAIRAQAKAEAIAEMQASQQPETHKVACEFCGFQAKSQFGLKSHMRSKHKDK